MSSVEAAVPVSARPKAFGPGHRFIYPLAETVVVDGDLSECAGAAPTLRLSKEAMRKFGSVDGGIADDADASARVWIRFTEEGFYVAGELKDDVLVGGAKGIGWRRHSMFGTDTLLVSFLSGQKAARASQQEVYLALTYYVADGVPRPQKRPSRYVSVRTEAGYRVEAFLPFTSIGWRPQPGDWLRFYVIQVDQDGGSDS